MRPFFLLLTGSLLLLATSSLTAQGSWAEQGLVLDESGLVLPGATVLQGPDSTYTVTDAQGRFRLPLPVDAGSWVQVSFVGYDALRVPIPLNDGKPWILRLVVDRRVLQEVLVSETHHHLEEALATAHIDEAALRKADRSSFAASLEAEPGVTVIRTGVGIAKPVIRGLSGQRLVVQDQGIKQEGQQWGADHGLALDPFAAERIEIIKGPGSLLYGSDALGGAVRVLPPAAPAPGQIVAGVETTYATVNQGAAGSVSAGTRQGKWYGLGRYSRQDFGDYAVPAEGFTFQGNTLPIVGGTLKNTAGQNEVFALTAGHLGKRLVQRWHGSHYRLDVGLFSGAVGIPRSYALEPDGDRRDIDNPSQSVAHTKLAYHLTAAAGQSRLTLDVGWQRNIRQEFSFPEFHSLPVVDPSNTLALRMDLQTVSVHAHLDRSFAAGWDATWGLDGQYQWHEVAGFERFLPAYRLWRSGLYGMVTRELKGRSMLTLGLRADAGANQSDADRRFIYNSSGSIVDSLLLPETDRVFGNVAFSVGYNRSVGSKQTLRLHAGKSYRIPQPVEMAANGVHHGTFRHERGDPTLRSEHGYQGDLGLSGQAGSWEWAVDAFANAYAGFIYLTPSGRLSPLPEAGQIFDYRQNDALFVGGEARVVWRPFQRLEASLTAESVFNRNLESGLPLPFTPPASFRSEWTWRETGRGFFSALEVFAAPRYTLAQNRVDRNELTTPAYFLLDAGVSLEIKAGKQNLTFSLQGFNLLNNTYFNHLSRYRLVGIPEPGRNVVLSLRVPLSFAGQ